MSSRSFRSRAVLAALPLLLTACAGAGAGDSAGDDPAAEESPSQATTQSGDAECAYTEGGGMAAKEDVTPPPEEPTATGDVKATLVTSVGELPVTLDAGNAPCTVNSFLSLAEQDYYDGSPCHRLTTEGIFVLQCGDPSGTGMGGPGYQYDDELTGDETYGTGTLAMANAGPGTNGSQFFIVYDDTRLPPNYTVFGSVSGEGIQLVQDVAEKGTEDGGPDGPPKQQVTITGISS